MTTCWSMCGGRSPENADAITRSSSRSHDIVAHGGIAEPPGRDIRQRQFAAEHRRRERRQEAQHGARFDHAGAERIGDHHGAVADRLHQTGHAQPRAGAQLQRIGEIGIETAQQHLGALQARHGADEDAVVADGQVFAFDQKKAEIAREIGVLEIGFVQRPRRQHADRRIVVAVERRQLRLEAPGRTARGARPEAPIDVGHRARQREPVLQRVARARRRLRAVAEHPPSPVRRAADIDAVEPQMRTARRLDADQRAKKFRIAGDDRGRQAPLAHEIGRSIDVREDRFEQFGALDEPGLERLPFRRHRSAAARG